MRYLIKYFSNLSLFQEVSYLYSGYDDQEDDSFVFVLNDQESSFA